MRHILSTIALILILSNVGRPQSPGTSGGLQVHFVTADPAGACAFPNYVTVNTTTGAMYACVGGTWTSIGGGAAGSVAFSGVTPGTNAGALVIGTAGSLNYSGTGTINANRVNSIDLTGLATGLAKITTTTGAFSTAVAGTDFVGGQAALVTAGLVPYITSAGILTQTSALMWTNATPHLTITRTSSGATVTQMFLWNAATAASTGASLDFGNAATESATTRITALRTNRATAADSDLVTSLFSGGSLIERFRIQDSGHIATSGTAPALTSCGTNPAITGTDERGTVTEGTISTGCVATFNIAYSATPSCTVTSQAGLGFAYTVSATAITITNVGALSSTLLDYVCVK